MKTIQFEFISPYVKNGEIRKKLPKDLVLATDGKTWAVGYLRKDLSTIALERPESNDLLLKSVNLYSTLPIYQ